LGQTLLNISSPVNEFLWTDTQIGGAVQTAKGSSAVAFYINIDNTGNSSPVFLKVYDGLQSTITVGTSGPDLIFKCLAGKMNSFILYTGSEFGFTFDNGISLACTTQNGTQGTTSPVNPVKVVVAFV
jgi:hypothetical protein